MHPLSQCLRDLQLSHVSIASNKADDAKKQCMAAVKTVSGLLKSGNADMAATKALAHFAADYYEELLAKGVSALSFLEKVLWLASNVHGHMWFPTIAMGSLSSMDIGLDPGKEELKVPELDIRIEFRSTSLEWSVRGLEDLYQDLLPNCSFVLSLLLMADVGKGENLRLLVREHDEGIKVCLRFNGTFREVAITLTLPHVAAPHEDRSLFVRSSSNADLKWPAYLEKAFLICLGQHYLFEGSNMAQDTYMLSGWLPEVRKMGEWSQKDIEQLWKYKQEGKVTLGVGTGSFSDALASQLGVIPEHDYVVCAYDKSGLTLKNPWDNQKAQKRILQVDMSLLGHFSYVYINWKPTYSLCEDTVLITSATKWAGGYIGELPQYEFTNCSDTCHNVAVVVEQFVGSDSQYCVTVYENSGGKLFTEYQSPRVAGGTFTNSRVHYINVAAEPGRTYTVVVKHLSGSTQFALSLHHDIPGLQLTKAKVKYAHTVPKIEGLWNFGYNGGNWANETYIDNPQYDVMVPASVTHIMMVLTAEKPADINLHLLHCENNQIGKKLRNFDKCKILFDERYLRIQVHDIQVEPGNYRLVVSSFDRENTGAFTLQMFNDGAAPVKLTQVPQALGTFTQNHQFLWNNSNRHKYRVTSTQNRTHVTFWFRASAASVSSSTYRPAFRASVFDINGEPIVVTRQWNDCLYGVFLECTLEHAGHPYILLIERFERGDGVCRVMVGSSSRVEIGCEN